MKKNRLKRSIVLILSMLMILLLPLEASAATQKATAKTTWQSAKAVKRGTTIVTVGDPRATNTNSGWVKFTAPSTKTYKISLSNLRRYGKKSTDDVIVTHADFRTPTTGGGYKTISFNQNKTNTYSLQLCTAKSRSIALKYGSKNVTAYTPLKSRTASIKLKKGQTICIGFYNTHTYKVSYDLKIQ